MRIHREGYSLLAAATGILLILYGLLLPVWQYRMVKMFSGLLLALWAWLLFFFRNPERPTPNYGERGIISPADGLVVAIEKEPEHEFFNTERIRLSIFMSVFDVHVNRIPLAGRVIYSCYHPGQYLVAFHPKSSELNERNTVVIQSQQGISVMMRQIAGLLARRIRCYVQPEQDVVAGQEMGFIKFGSRVDVFLPPESRIHVRLHQRVKGGETHLADLPEIISSADSV